MSIVVFILKIIGILLLALLLLAALVLLYPVSYRLLAVRKDELFAQGDFWWLFRLLRLSISVKSGEARTRFSICGICPQEKERGRRRFWKKRRGRGRSAANTEEADPDSREGAGTAGARDCDKPPERREEREAGTEKFQGDKPPERREEREAGTAKFRDGEPQEREAGPKRARTDAAAGKEPRRSRKKQRRAKPPEDFYESGRTKREAGRAGGAWREIRDEGNRRAAAAVWRETLYLLSRMKPRDAQADLSFSAGDPALTGEVTGLLSLLPFWYRDGMRACPDFLSDEAYVRGRILLRGRMSVVHIARSALRLIRNPDARRLYRKLTK